jgi:hypothetical protein
MWWVCRVPITFAVCPSRLPCAHHVCQVPIMFAEFPSYLPSSHHIMHMSAVTAITNVRHHVCRVPITSCISPLSPPSLLSIIAVVLFAEFPSHYVRCHRHITTVHHSSVRCHPAVPIISTDKLDNSFSFHPSLSLFWQWQGMLYRIAFM